MSFLELSYDFAYFCPNCDNYSDKQPCTNCGIQLDKTNIKSLREAWEIPPNPVKDIKELVKIDSKELEEIRKKPMGSHAVKFLTDLGLNNTEIKERRVSNHLVSLLDKKIDKLFTEEKLIWLDEINQLTDVVLSEKEKDFRNKLRSAQL